MRTQPTVIQRALSNSLALSLDILRTNSNKRYIYLVTSTTLVHGLAPTEFEEEDEEETEEEAEDEEENTEEEEAEEEEEEEDDLPRAPTLVSAANSFACGACLLALDPGV